MARRGVHKRRIALFVEGDSERGDARRKTLPVFFHNWLDPKLPEFSKVGIHAFKFDGVGDFLDDLARRVELVLTGQQANYVVGLVDLYGIPPDRIDVSRFATVAEKVAAARKHMRGLVAPKFRDRFR